MTPGNGTTEFVMHRYALLSLGIALLSAHAQPPGEAPAKDDPPAETADAPQPEAPGANRPAAGAPRPKVANDPMSELGGSDEAKAILRETLDAVAKARTLVFHSRTTNTGSLAGYSADTVAVVRMRRAADRPGAWQLHVTGSGTRKGEEEATSIDVVWGPMGATWLDHGARALYERPTAQSSVKLVQMALGCVPTQLLEKNSFSRETGALHVSLDATERVDGIECHVLSFKARKGSSTSRIWIGVSDRLPRKFERSNELKAYANTTTFELSDLRANEPLTEEDFRVELPEGYERIASWTSQPNARNPAAVTPPKTTAATAAAPSPAPRRAEPRPAPAPLAPDFDLRTPDGEHFTLAKLRGRVAVLYFWGTWSLPGRAGIAALQGILEELEDRKVRTLAIAVRERDKTAPVEFLKASSSTVTPLLDGEKTASAYGVVVFPTFVVLDRNGAKVGSVEGFKGETTAEAVRALIDAALAVEVTAVDVEVSAVEENPAIAPDGN